VLELVTNFQLNVVVEKETLHEKQIRAVGETEITSVVLKAGSENSDQCNPSIRAGDSLERNVETVPGRMAISGTGASLQQSGNRGRILADPRVYFLGPIDLAASTTSHELGDFIRTDTSHPALQGVNFQTIGLDVVATPGGNSTTRILCTPDLGASTRYQGEGERLSYAFHAVNFAGVPERYLQQALKTTKDVSISILDPVTRAPIEDSFLIIENVAAAAFSYESFKQRHLSGVEDQFILDLYGEYADSDYFLYTKPQETYQNGDRIRILSADLEPVLVSAQAPGYQPLSGRVRVGGNVSSLTLYLSPASESGEPLLGRVEAF